MTKTSATSKAAFACCLAGGMGITYSFSSSTTNDDNYNYTNKELCHCEEASSEKTKDNNDEENTFFGYFPKHQLFHPKRPYPAWDDNWDETESDKSGDRNDDESDNTSNITRHVILVR